MLGYSRVAQQYPFEMPRAMADAGYHTCAIGKLHCTPQRNTHGYHTALNRAARNRLIFGVTTEAGFTRKLLILINPDETGIGA